MLHSYEYHQDLSNPQHTHIRSHLKLACTCFHMHIFVYFSSFIFLITWASESFVVGLPFYLPNKGHPQNQRVKYTSPIWSRLSWYILVPDFNKNNYIDYLITWDLRGSKSNCYMSFYWMDFMCFIKKKVNIKF